MELRNHDVIRYPISGSTWCRHGLAVVYESPKGDFQAKDTYWGVGDKSIYGWLRPEEISDVVVIGNIDDFEHNKYVAFEDYAEIDKFRVPTGGTSAQNWIRKGTEPKPTLVYERLLAELEEAESEKKRAEHRIEYRMKLIQEHLDKHGVSVREMDKEKP